MGQPYRVGQRICKWNGTGFSTPEQTGFEHYLFCRVLKQTQRVCVRLVMLGLKGTPFK